MSTINESIAKEIIDNDGFYPHDGMGGPPDPQAFAVFTYENQWNGAIAWAIAYSDGDFARYSHCHNIQVKWTRDGALWLKAVDLQDSTVH